MTTTVAAETSTTTTTTAAAAAAATTTTTTTTTNNPYLADPLLQPFLAATFNPNTYLNATLPPLLPPSTLSSVRPASSVPLSTLSTLTSTHLSTLDLQAQRLQQTLTTLTDEILRLSPRLTYSIDLLRSDVASLSDELAGHTSAVVTSADTKPVVLKRLEMLTTVRSRVEEVVRVFGEAMEWGLEEDGEGKGEEVAYLLASGDVEGAGKRVAALRVLVEVFEGTVEGPARVAVVDRLDEKVMAALEKQQGKSGEGKQPVVTAEKKTTVEEKKEERGYYGLIEQLKGLRGMT